MSNVGSHSNATQKHSTRAQKMECYGSNPFVLKMDWSWATTFQLYIALYIAHELAFRKWKAEKREQSNPQSRMCICFDWTWIGEWRFHSECDPTLQISCTLLFETKMDFPNQVHWPCLQDNFSLNIPHFFAFVVICHHFFTISVLQNNMLSCKIIAETTKCRQSPQFSKFSNEIGTKIHHILL